MPKPVSYILVMFLLVAVRLVYAEGLIEKNGTLTMGECIETALKKNPELLAAESAVSAARSRIGQAQSNYYPQMNLTAGYKKTSSTSRAGGKTTETSDRYSGGLEMSLNIYDFGKTPDRVKVASLNTDSSRYGRDDTTARIILDVKIAYYGVLQALRNRDVAVKSVEQARHHLEQAKGFFELGVKPRYDVTKAEVDLSNSTLNLIKAENSIKTAFADLNNAMGVPDAPEYRIEDNLSFEKYPVTFEDALSQAYRNRPDLRAAIAKTEAAEVSVGLARKDYYPVLTGNAGYNWTGEDFPLDREWNAGATVSLPIFSGFLTAHQVAEAVANLNVSKAQESALRQAVQVEVQKAYIALQEAQDRISTAELAARQAAENLDLAVGRYEVGVGSPVEVTDAQAAYTNAMTAHIQALYDYKVAQASMEKAMGAAR